MGIDIAWRDLFIGSALLCLWGVAAVWYFYPALPGSIAERTHRVFQRMVRRARNIREQ